MSTKRTKHSDPLEQAIELALSPGDFISYDAAWSFVESAQRVVNDIEKIINPKMTKMIGFQVMRDDLRPVRAGSGSTLIACETAGRKAVLMGIDPVYCDVIIQRWETATGNVANRSLSADDL